MNLRSRFSDRSLIVGILLGMVYIIFMTQETARHVLMDLWPKDMICANHIRIITNLIKKSFTVVKTSKHNFSPKGETVVFILASSHFTLHTFPEHNLISLDIYSCSSEKELKGIISKIKDEIPAKHCRIKQFKRGYNYRTIG